MGHDPITSTSAKWRSTRVNYSRIWALAGRPPPLFGPERPLTLLRGGGLPGYSPPDIRQCLLVGVNGIEPLTS